MFPPFRPGYNDQLLYSKHQLAVLVRICCRVLSEQISKFRQKPAALSCSQLEVTALKRTSSVLRRFLWIVLELAGQSYKVLLGLSFAVVTTRSSIIFFWIHIKDGKICIESSFQDKT